jgi:hypothetical protein
MKNGDQFKNGKATSVHHAGGDPYPGHTRSTATLTEGVLAATLAAKKAQKEVVEAAESLDKNEHRKAQRFFLRFFAERGVVFTEQGEPAFPAAILADFDLGDLHAQAFSVLMSFFVEATEKVGSYFEVVSESWLDHGWQHGHLTTGDPTSEQFLVPVTVGVDLTKMQIATTGLARLPPLYLPPGAAAVKELERLVAAQHPRAWARWLVAERERSREER